jgi:hypothetical protein
MGIAVAPAANAQDACIVYYPTTASANEGDPVALLIFLKEYSGGNCGPNDYSGTGSITVSYSAMSGTATVPDDVSFSVSNLVLNSGLTGGNSPITIPTDALYEGPEAFTVELSVSNVSGLSLAAGHATVANFSIGDINSPPNVVLDVPTASVVESGAAQSVNIALDAVSGLATTVNLGFSGTATLTDDYTRSGTQVIIPAGMTAGSVTVSPVDDNLDEDPETVIVEITTVTNGTEDGAQSDTLTLTDNDDPPTVDFEASKAVSEAVGTVMVAVNLSAVSGRTATVPVTLTQAGTTASLSGSPLVFAAGETSKSVSVAITDDIVDESDELVVLSLGALTNADPGTTISHTLTIQDNDAVVTLSESGSPLLEAGGQSTITATIAAAQSLPITVNLAFSGSAAGGDYSTTSSSISIPAGNLFGVMTIESTTDTSYEGNETVIVDIDTVVDGQEGTPNQVTATIIDDDAPVTLAVTGSPTLNETGVMTYTASIPATQSLDVTVDLGFTGGTAAGTDYTASATQIVIPIGSTSESITVTGVHDILDETNESVVVSVTGVTNGQEPVAQSQTGYITDDDADLSFSKTVSTALDPDPADGTLSYTLSVTNNSGTTTATGIEVEDATLDISTPATPYASISVASTSGGTANGYAGTTWTIGDLAAGQTASIVLDVSLDVEYTITNAGEISMVDQSDPDSTPGNGSEDDYDTVTVRQYDFGDLPTGYTHTASHEIINGGPKLGATVDSDSGNQTSATVVGDDTDADGNDDDSATPPSPLALGSPALMTVALSGTNVWLYAWIDYDGNGFDLSEREFAGMVSGPSAMVTFTPPAGSTGMRQMRLRLCSVPAECENPDGAASDGEVEDYQVEIIGVDYGDADSGTYKTLFSQDGARHEVTGSITHRLGALIDGDVGAQPDATATGDDLNGLDDEDGIEFATDIVADAADPTIASLVVTTYGLGNLYGWIDFNQNGSFEAGDEQILTKVGIGTAATSVSQLFSFTIPAGTATGTSFARFRFCSVATTCALETGLATDGEVEDYQATILDAGSMPNAQVDIPDGIGLTSPFTLTLDGTDLVLTDASGPPNTLFRAPAGDLDKLTILGTAGNDNLTIDFGLGDPVPSGGLFYEGLGQGGSPGDILTVTGGAFDTVVHTFVNDNDGNVAYTGGTAAGTSRITYVGLEPVIQTVTVTDHHFVFTGGAETITLSDDGTGSDGQSLIESTLGESVNFTNPTGLLRVEAGTGDDIVNFTGLDDFITPATIRIEGNDGEDLFNITPSGNYGMLVDGGAPATCDGDILDLDLTGVSGQTQSIIAAGTGNWSFDAPHLTVNFTNMEIRRDAVTDVSVTAAWDDATGYPADEREVTYTLTNNGGDEVTCLNAAVALPVMLNPLGGYPLEVYPAAASGSYAPGTWSIDRLLSGDTATLTFRGVVNTIVSGSHPTSIDATDGFPVDPNIDPYLANNVASDNFLVQNVFQFPAKGTAISAAYMELPSGLDRMIVGLFQGSPGFDTAVFCRIPDPGGLFTAVGLSDHWRPCGEGLPYPLHVNDLMVDHRGTPGDVSDDRLWLASWGSAGLYYSDDFGETFSSTSPNLGGGAQPWANVYTITKDAGQVLYISANNGLVFRSFDDGANWQEVASLPGVASETPWTMQAHPSVAGTVYAGTFGNGVFVTTDFGFTWAELGGSVVNDALLDADNSGDDFAGHVFDFAFSPDDPDVLFAGTGKGVRRIPLDAAGVATGTWTDTGLVATLDGGVTVVPEVRVLGFAPASVDLDEDLLVGTWGLGVFLNEDPLAGAAYSPTSLRHGQVSTILFGPDGSVLVGTDQFGLGGLVPEASATSTEPTTQSLPEGFSLSQNYPNPFNPVTTIGFEVPESARVRLSVFDLLGREVAVLVDGLLQAGLHRVQFDAQDLPSGTYIYRLSTPMASMTNRLSLLK